MLTKTQTRQLLSSHNLRPRKRLGQNFLVDPNIVRKIFDNIEINKDDTILEIGPGIGALTEELVKRVKGVVGIEVDKGLCRVLGERLGQFENLKIICDDFLKTDIKEFVGNSRIKVIGCLPFYITTPIIEHLISAKASIDKIWITVQKEVAERIVSGPTSKDYGSLSCFVQYHTKPKELFKISKGCFFPEPAVDTTFLELDVPRRPQIEVRNEEHLFKLINSLFQVRRKTMANALSMGMGIEKAEAVKILTETDISPIRRPETLSLQEFAKILEALH